MYKKQITVEEARSLGVYRRHVFSPCTSDYPGEGLYLLDFGIGVKIGRSSNLRTRLKSYQSPWIREIQAAAYYRSKASFALETHFKAHFARSIQAGPRSVEFIVGNSFEYIKQTLERSGFFHKGHNHRYSI